MIIATALALAAARNIVEPRITEASMFKNGFAVVVRSIDVPGPGDYDVASMPQASLGTLWFSTTDGTSLDSLDTVDVPTTADVDIPNIDGILVQNVGKHVRLGLSRGDKLLGDVLDGKLLAASGEVLVIQTPTGTSVIPKNLVSSVQADGADLSYKTPLTSLARSLRFHVSGKPGAIRMVSLERGLTWSPGYSVDISDKSQLTVVAKATVLNDLEDLKGIDARFITGFPNVPFAQLVDPLVSGTSVDQFVALLDSVGASNGFRRDQNLMTQNAQMPAPARFGEMGMPVAGQGSQLEDLFFYSQPKFELKRGQRSYFSILRAKAPYKEIYTCDIPDAVTNNTEYRAPDALEMPEDVWHTVEFKNTSGQPLTTAPATTFKNGAIVGQDTMHYVPAGGEAELRITKALDIRPEATEEETARVRGAVKNPGGYPVFDLVTVSGTIAITSTKSDKVQMHIRKTFTGELVSASGNPKAVKTAKGLRETNPGGVLIWDMPIGGGKSQSLTYKYQVYVRSQN